ncbi:17632_t:CDS:2 [Cetraspora pellucida]|uniref:17632_t:CDS:1 n=1 Tax=Cetraspora pellucida TaxID=1433469 RepID=A0ACA9LGL9_9GLOM|nr:17632_t:CDS:2 [Cetraspora pellucida]
MHSVIILNSKLYKSIKANLISQKKFLSEASFKEIYNESSQEFDIEQEVLYDEFLKFDYKLFKKAQERVIELIEETDNKSLECGDKSFKSGNKSFESGDEPLECGDEKE